MVITNDMKQMVIVTLAEDEKLHSHLELMFDPMVANKANDRGLPLYSCVKPCVLKPLPSCYVFIHYM